ncbi:RHS repeat-associated core domain-containing protein [Cellulomonas bogoriensis]
MGTFRATYDASGNVVEQRLPGGVVQSAVFDRAGQEVGLGYQLPGTGGELLSWTLGRDAQGRIVTTSGPSAEGGGRETGYTYDAAERLVGVVDVVDGVCAQRTYTFDVNGNRTGLASRSDEGDCQAGSSGQGTKAWTYDAADRVQRGAGGGGAYVYDALGRQTRIPGTDTPAGAAGGDLVLGYFHTDAPRSLAQDGVTTTYELDAVGRRSTSTTTGAGTSTTVRHYVDSSDNPGWATTTTGQVTVTTRYGGSIAGDLGVTVTDGVVQVTLADPHGNLATVFTVGATTPVGSMGMWDEYGNTLTTGPDTGALNYGWLGAKERATDTTGLLLMGARLYNPVTGLFTSVDPVVGGNTTAYAYPQDPVNKTDLDGHRSKWRKAWSKVGSAARTVGRGASAAWKFGVRHRDSIALGLTVVGLVVCSACAVAGLAISAVSAGYSCAKRRVGDCAIGVASVATGGTGAALLRGGVSDKGRSRTLSFEPQNLSAFAHQIYT